MTVPACQPCNDSFKLDDEYFRVILSVRADLPPTSDSAFLRTKTKQTLRAPEASGLRAAIGAARTMQPVHSKGGIYLGHALALRVEATRIVRTAERIIRGMYAKLIGQVLPQGYEAAAVLFDLQRDGSALLHPDVQEALAYLGEHGQQRTFGSVLDVWYAPVEDDEYSSMWVVRMHEAFTFIGYTCPRDA